MQYAQLLVIAMFIALTGSGYAQTSAADPQLQVTDQNCWVEIFEDDEFDQDDPHVKLIGPKEYPSLKNLMGRDWHNDIESLVVGPNATVKAYSKTDFSGTEIAFTPNQRVPKLSKLDMANEIESMKITCGKP